MFVGQGALTATHTPKHTHTRTHTRTHTHTHTHTHKHTHKTRPRRATVVEEMSLKPAWTKVHHTCTTTRRCWTCELLKSLEGPFRLQRNTILHTMSTHTHMLTHTLTLTHTCTHTHTYTTHTHTHTHTCTHTSATTRRCWTCVLLPAQKPSNSWRPFMLDLMGLRVRLALTLSWAPPAAI